MTTGDRVTIKRVAREAGVSTQTVSRVINDRPDVAPETRRRVQAVIDRLGYRPSRVARSLRGRSFTLGVVGYGLEYFGPSRALTGVEQQADELGYSLLLDLVRQPEEAVPERVWQDMLSRHVDGIVWAVPEIGENSVWVQQDSARISVPVVFLSRQPSPGLFVLSVDNRRGGRLAVDHLLDQGCQNIGLITGPSAWWEARQRQLGWQDALEGAGLVAADDLVVEGDWSAASGESGLHTLLQRHPEIDGVFASNDQMALGALRAANQMERMVPHDLAIVGFDDIPEAAYFSPPLSTVRQDMIQLGRRAVQALDRVIQAVQRGEEIPTLDPVWLQPQLVVRESSVRQST